MELNFRNTNIWLADTLPYLLTRLGTLHTSAIDSILDNRDGVPFDGDWVAASATLDAYKQALPEETLARLTDFSDSWRQQIFLRVIKTTNSPDLAAYVSDDFGLIVEAMATQWRHDFIDTLAAVYRAGNIPSGMSPAAPTR